MCGVTARVGRRWICCPRIGVVSDTMLTEVRFADSYHVVHLAERRVAQVLGNGHEPAIDVTAFVVTLADPVEQIVQLGHRCHTWDRDQRPPSEAADLTLDTTFLVSALDTGDAEERVEPVVRTHQRESF